MANQVEQDYAEYNLHTNTLTFYFSRRGEEEYAQLMQLFCTKLGMSYGRGRKCFYGRWESEREDAILQYVAEIPTLIDDDAGYSYRLERFEGYAESATERSAQHHAVADQSVASIPFGQPILVGHHSERRHHRAIERMEHHMQAALDAYYKSERWKERLAAAQVRKEQSENPGTVKRRIAKLEKELAVHQALLSPAGQREWKQNHRDSLEGYEAAAGRARRWIAHLAMVIEYQKKLYVESGMLPSDRGELLLEKGGAVKQFAWWRNSYCWLPIVKINRTSVTYLSAHGSPAHPSADTVKLDNITEALSGDEYQAHPDWAAHGHQLWEAYCRKPARPDGMEAGAGLKYKRNMTDTRWNGPFPILRVNPTSLTILHRFDRHALLKSHKVDREGHLLEVVPKSEFQPWWEEQELLINLERHYFQQGWNQSGQMELSVPEQARIAERLAAQGLVEQLGQGLFRLLALMRRDLIIEHHLVIGPSDDEHLWGRWIEKTPEANDAIRAETRLIETSGPYPMHRSLIHDHDNRYLRGVEVYEFGRLCRPSQVYIIDPPVYQAYLEMLPPKVQALNWFIFAEGDQPILFWQEEEKIHYAYRSYTYKRLGGYIGLDLSGYDQAKVSAGQESSS